MGRRRKITTREMTVNCPRYAVTGQGKERVLRSYTGSDALDTSKSKALGSFVCSFKVTCPPKQTEKLAKRELDKEKKRTGDKSIQFVMHDEKNSGNNKVTSTYYVYKPETNVPPRKELAKFKLNPGFA